MIPLLKANLKMMTRDRQTIFWALAFPVIFVVVFGLFDLGGGGLAQIAVIDQADTALSLRIVQQIEDIDILDVKSEYSIPEEAGQALKDGDLEYLLVIPPDLSKLRSAVRRPDRPDDRI